MTRGDENAGRAESGIGWEIAGAGQPHKDLSNVGRVVLVLQGGGALGAYHGGVYEALHEAGIEPDWVIGTSIGSVNGSLIAGNEPADRLDRLKEFWQRTAGDKIFDVAATFPVIGPRLPVWAALASGVNGFYTPNPLALFGPTVRLPVDATGLYSAKPLERTLSELVDFARLAKGSPRLTVGAANIKTADMRYFDSRDTQLTVRHVMASGAMPPAFSPIGIDGTHYWDGGLVSNTPLEAIFDDNPRRNSLVFSAQVWHAQGALPENIWDVMIREKEIQFASATSSQIKRQNQIHHLRHIIADFFERLPPEARQSDEVREMRSYGCLTQVHVVRLLAPRDETEDHMSEIDFSTGNIRARWSAGYKDARRALEKAPWEKPFDPLEGLHLHEV
jgi:NTE family protein